MAPIILLALIAVPLIEIAIFIEVGGLIGPLPTIALVIAIAIGGTWLLRRQGLGTFQRAQAALNRGEMPVADVMDGFVLVFAALLMVTPGLLTDAIGLLLLIPALRRRFGQAVVRWAMKRGRVEIFGMGDTNPSSGFSGRPSGPYGRGPGPIIEGEAEAVGEPADAKKPNDKGSSPWIGGPSS